MAVAALLRDNSYTTLSIRILLVSIFYLNPMGGSDWGIHFLLRCFFHHAFIEFMSALANTKAELRKN
jgi:hypothetical protein